MSHRFDADPSLVAADGSTPVQAASLNGNVEAVVFQVLQRKLRSRCVRRGGALLT